jgi:hypothetical protein
LEGLPVERHLEEGGRGVQDKSHSYLRLEKIGIEVSYDKPICSDDWRKVEEKGGRDCVCVSSQWYY